MMKISFVNIGDAWLPLKSLLETIPGVEVILPSPIDAETLEIGSANSPKSVCMPFISGLGDMLKTLKNEKIDVFFTFIDCKPCRYGIFSVIQEKILQDMGYDEVKVIHLDQGDLINFGWMKSLNKLSLEHNKIWQFFNMGKASQNFIRKAKLIDDINRLESYYICREIKKGTTVALKARMFIELDTVETPEQFRLFREKMISSFEIIQIDEDKTPYKVILGGELHTCLVPGLNGNIKQKLGEFGLEIHQNSTFLDWVLHRFHINYRKKQNGLIAKEYLTLDVGGDAIWTIGEYLTSAKEGFDGFIHLYPYSCMPGVMTNSYINELQDDRIPAISFSFSGKLDENNLNSRLEMFVKSMEKSRKSKNSFDLKEVPDEKILIDQVNSADIGKIFEDPTSALNDILKIVKDLNPVDFFKNVFNKKRPE